MSRKWHLEREDVKQKAIVKDLSKIFGAKSLDWDVIFFFTFLICIDNSVSLLVVVAVDVKAW